ncbi:hypothetical protein [Pantoea sp. y20]
MVKFTLQWLVFCLMWSALALLSLGSRDPWSLSTTTWLPAGVLFFTLVISPQGKWPLWLTTSMLLHTLCGFYMGRPLPLAVLFTVFDGLSIPLCALAYLMLERYGHLKEQRRPLLFSLLKSGVLATIAFSAGALLTLCLWLSNYDIASSHLVSWSLALLTGCLAFLPLARSIRQGPNTIMTAVRGTDAGIMGINVIIMLFLFAQSFAGPKSILSGFNPTYLLLSSLLLSSLLLNGRLLGILLVINYVTVIKATLIGLGPFVWTRDAGSSPIWGIWSAQWYVAFSSLLAFTLFRFAESGRLQKAKLARQQMLSSALSTASTHITFHLASTDRRLTWSVPTNHFFKHSFPVATTLALLEASCEAPFIVAFDHWLLNGQVGLFIREINILKGQQSVPCLLVIAPALSDKMLSGGIAVLAD